MSAICRKFPNPIDLPKPAPKLWVYDHNDQSDEKPSWKYTKYLVRQKGEGNHFLKWVKNPHFAYAHLSPWNENDISSEEFTRLVKDEIKQKKIPLSERVRNKKGIKNEKEV